MENIQEPATPGLSLERVLNDLARQRTMLEEDYSSPSRYAIGQTIYQATLSGASVALSPGFVNVPVGGICKVVFMLQATGVLYEALSQNLHRFWRLAREGKPADALLLRMGVAPELFRLDLPFAKICRVKEDPVADYKEGESLPRQIRCEPAMPLPDFLQRPADGAGDLEECCMQWALQMLNLGWRVILLGGPGLWNNTQSLARLNHLTEKARQHANLSRFGIIVGNRTEYQQIKQLNLDALKLTCL
jgi:hypothetical protein